MGKWKDDVLKLPSSNVLLGVASATTLCAGALAMVKPEKVHKWTFKNADKGLFLLHKKTRTTNNMNIISPVAP